MVETIDTFSSSASLLLSFLCSRFAFFSPRYSHQTNAIQFQDKTNNVIDLYKDILRNVEDLATCPYTPEAFSDLLGKIQAAIDKLNLEGYANLEHWVSELDKRIEGILLQRLTQIIQVWCSEFGRTDEGDGLIPRREVVVVGGGKRRGAAVGVGGVGDKKFSKDEKVRNPL